jgi:Flp pilus assembly protein TadG
MAIRAAQRRGRLWQVGGRRRLDGRLPALRRGRGQRGAAMVEFALVIPVFLLVVMGVIDFGATFNDYNAVRQGVREGARQAVVADWDLADCTGTASQKISCVTKDRIDLDPSRVRVKVDVDGDYQPGDQLTVCTMYRARSLTGMFSGLLDDQVLTSHITMRIEQIDDADPVTDLAETPLTGETWSWC